MRWDITITDNTGTEYVFGVEAKSRAAALDKVRQVFNRQVSLGRYAVGGVAVRRDAPRRRKSPMAGPPAKYHQVDPARGFKINFAPTKRA